LPGSWPIVKSAAENIMQHCAKAIVIMETNPVDPLNYAMYLMSPDKDRSRYIGYALNDTLRFRMWAAEALGVEATRITGTVIGEHGHSQVLLFSSLRLDGQPVEISREIRNKIKEQPPLMLEAFETLTPRRTSGWTSAYGLAMVVEAIKNNSHAVLPCNAVLQGEYGLQDISMTAPVTLGKTGIEEVQVLELSAEEKVDLELTVKTLQPYMHTIEEYLGLKNKT
jgi:malate dehydrogenase